MLTCSVCVRKQALCHVALLHTQQPVVERQSHASASCSPILDSCALDHISLPAMRQRPSQSAAGLDARAAAIVMRTVKNTVKTGRTVVCTIHQPSLEIFQVYTQSVLHHIMLSRMTPSCDPLYQAWEGLHEEIQHDRNMWLW